MGLFIYHRELIIQSGLRSALFDDNLWSPFRTSIIETVGKCLPTSVTSLTKLKKKYMKMRMNLLCLVNRDVSQLTIDSLDQRQEAQLILQIMSFHYIETFHKLTTVPSMGELRSVPEQVHSIFMSSINTPTAELFPDTKTQEHSYYILGFLGHQSAKQAKRRAKSSAMSKLLASFASSHFIQQNHEAYSALLADESIPSGSVG